MRRALLGLLCLSALLSGCPTPPPPCSGVAGPGGFGGGLGIEWFNNTETLSYSLSSAGGCVEEVVADSVKVDVRDPFNREVPHEVHFVAPSGSDSRATATVTFKPQTTGFFSLMAVFSPVGGRVQREVLIVNDRGTAAELTLQGSCTSLFETDTGALLCGPRLLRNDGGTSVFAGATERFFVRGSTLWSYETQTRLVRRYALTDDDAVNIPDAGYDAVFFDPERLLPAGPDDLVVLTQTHAHLLRSDGGEIQQVDDFAHRALSTNVMGFTTDEFFYLAEGQTDTTAESSGSTTSVCSYRIKPTGFGRPDAGEGACWRFTGKPIAAGEHGLWTWGDRTFVVRLISISADGGLVSTDAMSLGRSFAPALSTETALGTSTRPVFAATTFNSVGTTAQLVPRSEGGRIVMDHFRSATAGVRAQDDLVWQSAGSSVQAWSAQP